MLKEIVFDGSSASVWSAISVEPDVAAALLVVEDDRGFADLDLAAGRKRHGVFTGLPLYRVPFAEPRS